METKSYTSIVIQTLGQNTLIEVHRTKRFRVWRYETPKLTSNQLMRLYRVMRLTVWEQSVEFSYDLSPVITLDTFKPVLSRKNSRLLEIMKS